MWEFRVLGPVEVWHQGRMLPPLPRKPTALLTAGLVDAGHMVPVDRLVDAIWGDDPPASAAKLVQGYVVRLRQVLHRPGGGTVIVTRPRGYQFQHGEGQLDLQRFLSLAERGRAASASGEHRVAAEAFETALGLWRGPALGGPTSPALQAEAARLEEMRLATAERLLESRLNLGGGSELVSELTRLVHQQPLRERPRALLMTALERSGRRADALHVYRDGHCRLRTELGIEPGRELKQAHARLLAAEPPSVRGAGAANRRAQREPTEADIAGMARPAQLPAAPQQLTGRATETARLEAVVRGGREHRVCVVHGMPGVGKTALVLHLAHRVAAAFPDGVMYADLSSGDPARVTDPAEILAGFLRALGLRPGNVPSSLPERAAEFRTLLVGRRVLVILDNAADERQVRWLLPGAGRGSFALISSRRTLPGLEEAEQLGLDVLSPARTLELLTRLMGPDRTVAEPAAAAEIARLSGGLPLAVRAVASRLEARSRWPLRVLAHRLRDEAARLDEMTSGDLDVRAGIEVAYRSLPEPQRRIFRRLGMLESPDFAAWVAAPLAATAVPEGERLVDRLADAHLLESRGVDCTGQVRYRFHDLVRLYARERAEREETREDRLAALSRLLRTWLVLTRRAGGAGTGAAARPSTSEAADGSDVEFVSRLLRTPRAWLRAEDASLTTLVALAARLGLDSQAYDLASAHLKASLRADEPAPRLPTPATRFLARRDGRHGGKPCTAVRPPSTLEGHL